MIFPKSTDHCTLYNTVPQCVLPLSASSHCFTCWSCQNWRATFCSVLKWVCTRIYTPTLKAREGLSSRESSGQQQDGQVKRVAGREEMLLLGWPTTWNMDLFHLCVITSSQHFRGYHSFWNWGTEGTVELWGRVLPPINTLLEELSISNRKQCEGQVKSWGMCAIDMGTALLRTPMSQIHENGKAFPRWGSEAWQRLPLVQVGVIINDWQNNYQP